MKTISDIYILYHNYLVFIPVVVGLYYLIRKPIYTFYIAVFTLPFKSLFFWAGTTFEAWKILSLAAFLMYGLPLLLSKKRNNLLFQLFTLYILYVVLLTIAFFFLIPETYKYTVTGGFLKNEGRWIYQILFFLINVNFVLWPVYVIKDESELHKTFQVIIYSIIVLSILGILQEASIKMGNFDPFPIHRLPDYEVGVFDYEGGMITADGMDVIHRMNSLGGEPKHFAVTLILGIVIILLYGLNRKTIVKYNFVVFLMFLICLFATYSTTGYIWFGVMLAVILMLYRAKVFKRLIIIILILSCFLIAYLMIKGNLLPYVDKTLAKIGFQDTDKAVFDYLKDNPIFALTGVGLGNIHFFAASHLPLGHPLANTSFKGVTGFFLLLGDTGFLGLLILFLFLKGLLHSLRSRMPFIGQDDFSLCRIVAHFSILISILFLLRYFELFYLALGVMFYLHIELSNKNNTHHREVEN